MERIWRSLKFLIYLFVAVLLLLEIIYRNYWFDFYRPELLGLNEALTKQEGKPSILVIGDSFTAHPESYVRHLRQVNPSYQIINAGVPGTSIHANLRPMRKRIRQFKPDVLIYQIYLGNDFWEFKHRISGSAHWTRRVYWWLSDRVHILAFLNYRLRAWRKYFYDDLPDYSPENRQKQFDPSLYTARTKLFFSAEERHLEDVIFMQGKRRKDIYRYVSILKDELNKLPDELNKLIVIIPHQCQVADHYQQNMRELGASFSDQHNVQEINYPLYEFLQNHLSDQRTRVINPLRTLQHEERRSGVFYHNDPHFNPDGHSVLGREIASILKTQMH